MSFYNTPPFLLLLLLPNLDAMLCMLWKEKSDTETDQEVETTLCFRLAITV